ncbi:hypothetical protein E3N88_36561 [Mikania micrantha]|uniref:Uncharacterized protein n=1 Tax=Mikania micrantha TaxID=192012 RepID=A0A5N6M4L4_9ASTR|nr:hypothetical protein E3N88_36561 [Mikania micrantha]
MPRSSRTGTPLEIDQEIEKTARKLRKQAKLQTKLASSSTSTFSPPIRALITSIAEDSKHSNQEEDWYPDVPRAVKEVSTPHLETEIAELKKMVMQLTKDKGVEPQGRACGICLQVGHPTDMCPMLQEDMEQAQAMGGFQGQNSRQFEHP